MKIPVKESAQFEMHEPEEWLAGKIIDIEETEPGKFGPGLKIVLVLDDDEPNDDGSDNEVWAYTSQKLSTRSKLFAYASAILGDEMPDVGQVLDLDLLIGKKVDVFFERYTGVDRETGAPVEKEKVTRMRARKARATKADPDIQSKQAEATAAKKRTRPVITSDEAPF